MFGNIQLFFLLPPAYVVRREGNSFTLFVSSHLGSGQVRSVQPGRGGGQVQLAGGEGSGPAGRGGVRSSWQGGGRGSAKIGQQNEYSLHGGWYASCVHAGGLSCYYSVLISHVPEAVVS